MAWPDGTGVPKRRELLFGTRLVPCYSERPATIDAMFRDAVSRRPDGESLVDGERRYSYAQLDGLVTRAVAGLAARGARPGERMALVMSNRAEFLIALLAAARAGICARPRTADGGIDQSSGRPGGEHSLTCGIPPPPLSKRPCPP